ncbi:thioesterase II family protein [Umezawaea endophytica]|uniref:Alpha/beta fold hydrolase n=1 Tax=Umezawaea endophytica TaxID=1654476 RepID=A0A9X2VXT7_9PSEU|nr:alpha/beta fold hydrolase [Umezawaea endophytica]MCS7484851.1 alpha/beta fold hydrolase [Umezawaea endophytica]
MADIDSAEERWLRRYLPSENAAIRLVCFPHAGGSASFYRPVALSHAPRTDVLVLQYPGRQDRRHEPFVETIDEYADLIAELLAALPPKPTVYFGHSMGAILGFEVAHRLEPDGRGPRSLVVSGRRAPSTSRPEEVHRTDDAGILADMSQLEGTGSAVLGNEEIVRLALPAIRNDYRAIELYQPNDRVVSCPITALIGVRDPKSTVAEADRWREHTDDRFRVRQFPGGHFYLTDQHSQVNAEIAAELAKVALGPVGRGV